MRVEDDELRDDARAARLLHALPTSAPVVVARLRARLRTDVRRPGEISLARGLRLISVGAIAGALAAAGLLVVRSQLEPTAPVAVPVAATLHPSEGWTIDNSIPFVALSYMGSGTVEGTSSAPRIKWDSGLLNVEVSPDHDIKLAVTTREAEVRVIGTGFTVSRDLLGTRVDVRHGRVEVDCGTDGTRALGAGDGLLCQPHTAAGLLGRARELQRIGAPAADAIETLDRGLAIVGPQPAVRDELTVRRIRALYDLGRHGEALDGARAYLAAGGGARVSDVEQLAAAAAATLGGCAVAAPWMLEAGPTAIAACEGR